jgi:glycosyltransferase involved in cell wall biosynthesis
MRVAVNGWFWDSPASGSGQYVRRLVRQLAASEQGVDAEVVRPGASRSNLAKVWFEQVRFPRACARIGAGVAHVPYWAPPLRSPVPTVVTIHDLIPLVLADYRGGPLVRLYTRLVSAASSRAALVLADSAASRRDIVDRLRIPGSRVRTVYLAAGKEYSPGKPASDAATCKRYRLPERYLLYLGGFDVRKNVGALLAAYARARPGFTDSCSLVVAGRLPSKDTPFAPDPRRLAATLGLGEGPVRFAGFVEEGDKPALYRGATALVFPSTYEGFGLPPLEAMACGTPVVCSDTGSLREIVGEGGIVVVADDLGALSGALVDLVNDSALRAQLANRALGQASRFSWQATARRTYEAYRDVASGTEGDCPGR